MNEIIVITTDQFRELLMECLTTYFSSIKPEPIVEEPKHLHSLKELASFLKCSIVTAQKIKDSGRIRFRQHGRKCLFITTEVLQDLEMKYKKRK
jgi:Protein of unknown function (DUF3853)